RRAAVSPTERRGSGPAGPPVPRTCRRGRGHMAWGEQENWRWRAGPVVPGAATVFDLDGVLSDAASRQHYLESGRRDWDAFFDACGDDPLIEEVACLLDL